MNGAAPAKPVVVTDHMGLVHACAHRLRGRGVEYEDLVQTGCVGLMKAARAFDHSRGLQFSTYAVPVILGEMRRLFRDGQSVKVGRSCMELANRLSRERERFAIEFDREPTVCELAKRLAVSEEKAAEALAAGQSPLSLTTDEEDGGGQIDIPEESPEERITEHLSLRQVLSKLAPEDQRLIQLRYGAGLTQTVAGAQLGMTQVQVSRREKRLLQELRAML